jgi:hypothetical protein
MFEGGLVTQTVVEMQQGLLLVMAIGDGSSLAVLASDCDIGLVAYEMALLVEKVTRTLAPDTARRAPASGWQLARDSVDPDDYLLRRILSGLRNTCAAAG